MRGITDPMARQYWRDYQRMVKGGNPFGLSFVEYVAQRVLNTREVVVESYGPAIEWHIATCGHQHPWGRSCNSWTAT